jgi:hypothetical protein
MELDYLSDSERQIVVSLVNELLGHGCRLSVHTGGEWMVKRSRDAQSVLEALASTDRDLLLARGANGERIGAVLLIYGNGPDVIHDYDMDIEPFIVKTQALADRIADHVRQPDDEFVRKWGASHD